MTFSIAGMNEDGAQFLIEKQIMRENGKLCATMRTRGIWLDLGARKSVVPPDGLLKAMRALPKTCDYANPP